MTYLLYEILVGFFSNILVIIPAIICFIAIKKGKAINQCCPNQTPHFNPSRLILYT